MLTVGPDSDIERRLEALGASTSPVPADHDQPLEIEGYDHLGNGVGVTVDAVVGEPRQAVGETQSQEIRSDNSAVNSEKWRFPPWRDRRWRC